MQADANARIAGAPLLPVVDLQRQRHALARFADHGGGSGGASGVVAARGSSERCYSTSLSASYEIDFWGKNRAALRAAEELAVASRFDREVVALTTVVSVANSYFLVLAAQDRLRIARENLAAATRVFNLIKQRFDVGTASALDIAQQESLVATAARLDPAAGADLAAEHRHARGADRPHAGSGAHPRRQHVAARAFRR